MGKTKFFSKRAASIIIAMLMMVVVATVALSGTIASAETSGDFTYTVKDGKATITGYSGSATNVTIPSKLGGVTVTEIAGKSFTGNTTITSVTIPATVTVIGGSGSYDDNGAFAGCKNLQNVTITPGTGTESSIEREAFRNCISLQSIDIPACYKNIGESAFEGCVKLTSLKINESSAGSANQSINSYAFLGCSMLKTVSLPTTLNSIGYRSFEGTAIKNLVIPEGVKVVGAGAFANCNSLLTVSIPSTVTELQNSGNYDDYGVFANCKNLQSVTIAPSNDYEGYIGRDAFRYCISLQSIEIPGNYTSVGEAAFVGCENLKSLIFNESSKGYSNQKIDAYAFEDCTSLETVSLPKTLKSIAYKAFHNTSIKKLVIPEGVETIEAGAFMDCNKLLTVSIPSTVTELQNSGNYDDNGVFANCKSLQSVTIAPSNDYEGYIGRDAFRYCISLQSIEIPGNYTSVGEAAFVGCTSLKSLKFAESSKGYSNQKIDSYAFEDCTSLEAVSLPKTLKSIAYKAFHKTAIKKLVIPEGVETIGAGAFMDCNDLLSVSISSTVTSLDSSGNYDDIGVFANCKNLKVVTIAPSEDYEGKIGRDAFVYCTSLQSIEIPSNYTSIGEAAFYGCSSLKVVVFNDSSAVYANQSVGAKAFYGCTVLETVHLPGNLGSVGDKCFDGSKTNLTICAKSMDSYAKTYADNNGIPFVLCSGEHELPDVPDIPDTPVVTTYTLSYNANGGSGAPAAQTGASTYTISTTVPVRSGYKFLGWAFDKSAASASCTGGANITLTSDTVLYAVWQKEEAPVVKTYTLSYNANGGSGAPAAQTGASTYTISTTVPVRSGYKFLGWAFDKNATSASCTGGANITISSDTVLYAVWQKVETPPVVTAYTLSYNANGGSGAPAAQTGSVTYTISSTVPVRSGYKFLGWATSASATSATYTAGKTITLTKNTVLYAVWQVAATEPAKFVCPYCGEKFGAEDKYEDHVEEEIVSRNIAVVFRNPSTTLINYGDSIILHVDTYNLPEGSTIKWSVSNGNFAIVSYSVDRESCTITPNNTGDTVITATVYDAEGKEICSDSQMMSAKAGIWQKIVAFFKKLFGLTKTIPEAIKDVF